MVIVRMVLILLAFVLLLVLALTNAQELATARVFGMTYEHVPVAFIMLYAFAFGALCVGIFSLISEIQLRARLRRLRKEIDALTDELAAFRNAPLEAPKEEQR